MRAHLPTIECEVCKHCVILACWPERDLRDLRLQGEAFVMGLELLGPLTPPPTLRSAAKAQLEMYASVRANTGT